MAETPPGVTIEIPVRWGDMDAMGHVNNTVYFQYCESARIAYFEAIDLPRHKRSPTEGPGLVAANLNFRRQVRYPGRVRVTVHTTGIRERSWTLDYVVRDSTDDAVVADGGSVVVWVDYAAAKAVPLPESLVEAIARLEGQQDLQPR